MAERNVLARSPGWPSRHEPDRSQGFPIPADNYSNELARVCDYVGKSPAWRSLDASVALAAAALCYAEPGRCRQRKGSTPALYHQGLQ